MPILPFIQDTHLNTTPYAGVDYGFLLPLAQLANQRYEQGLQQVESDYSAVLNADVTDQANIQKKQEYIKTFQQGLNELAGTNLSLPKAQMQAEKIMAPFWQDDKLLKDMAYTRFKKSEIQKGYAAQFSKDEDIRKTYNPASTELLELQLNRLKNANRDEGAYRDLDWDTWTPFSNVQNDLAKHKKDDGFEVTMDMRDGNGGIVTVTNGPSSISNYKVYADGILGSNYNKQYNVLGKVAKERQVQSLQQQGYTREQALEQIATPMYESVKGSYEKRLDAFSSTITQKNADLKKLTDQVAKQGGKPDPVQADNIKKLQLELNNFQSMHSQLDSHYKDFTSDSGRRGFMMQPETGLAQMYRNEDIDKWAYAMSQDVGVAIKKDDIFWEGKKLGLDYMKLGEEKRHHIQEEGIGWMNAQSTAANSQIAGMRLRAEFPDLFSNGVAPGGRFSGKSTNQVWTVDPTEAANTEREKVHNNIYNGIYSPTGLTGILYKLPPNTATPEEVNQFTEFMNKYYTGGIELNKGNNGQWVAKGATPEQLQSYWKVARYLHDQTGINTSNVEGAHNALLGYTANYIKEHTKRGAIDSQEAENIRNIYNGVKENLAAYQKDDAQRKSNLTSFIKSGEGQRYQYLTRPDGGSIRYINEEDMAHDFPNITLLEIGSRQSFPLTGKEMAKLYKAGKIYMDQSGEMIIGGKNHIVTSIGNLSDDKNGSPAVMRAVNDWYNGHVRPKYNTSQQLASDIKTLNNKVIPGTEFYKSANNIVGNRFTYDIDDDKHQVNRDRLKELVSPGNYTNMYTVGTGNNAEVSPQVQGAVQNMLNNPDYKQYIGTSYTFHTKGFNGKQMAEIKIADELPKNAPGMYKDLQGKTILIEKSPDASGTYVNQYPIAEDYSYHPLNKGESISSDPLDNAVGMGSYTISPYPKYNPTHYTVTMTKKLHNHKTGKDVDTTATQPVAVAGTDPYKLQQDVRSILMANGANYFQNQNILRTNINNQ